MLNERRQTEKKYTALPHFYEVKKKGKSNHGNRNQIEIPLEF